MDATSSRFLSAAPQPQSDMAGLPDELVLQIVLRIRDTTTLRSLAQTCTRFANLSRVPEFANALTDQFFNEQCTLLRTLRMPDRPTRIYQLACRIATRLQPSHLQQMMACLEFPDEQDSATEDTEREPHDEVEVRRNSTLVRAIIGAAISSGRTEGFNEQVKQYALELVNGIEWDSEARTERELPLPRGSESHVALSIDALFGIRDSISLLIAQSSITRKSFSQAYLLKSAAPLPMRAKLPLLESIMNSNVMEDDMMASFLITVALAYSASYPEALDVVLAQRFFGMLYPLIERPDRVSDAHVPFARMLPPLPWRENSKRALDWLMKALPRVRRGLSPQAIEWAIPAGIFSSREIEYLAQSLLDGSFSWEALEKIDPAGSDK